MDYEKTLNELNELLENMESEKISLDEMMNNYKRAMDLYKDLNEYLENYKKEIKIITEEGFKDFREEDIENDDY